MPISKHILTYLLTCVIFASDVLKGELVVARYIARAFPEHGLYGNGALAASEVSYINWCYLTSSSTKLTLDLGRSMVGVRAQGAHYSPCRREVLGMHGGLEHSLANENLLRWLQLDHCWHLHLDFLARYDKQFKAGQKNILNDKIIYLIIPHPY